MATHISETAAPQEQLVAHGSAETMSHGLSPPRPHPCRLPWVLAAGAAAELPGASQLPAGRCRSGAVPGPRHKLFRHTWLKSVREVNGEGGELTDTRIMVPHKILSL